MLSQCYGVITESQLTKEMQMKEDPRVGIEPSTKTLPVLAAPQKIVLVSCPRVPRTGGCCHPSWGLISSKLPSAPLPAASLPILSVPRIWGPPCTPCYLGSLRIKVLVSPRGLIMPLRGSGRGRGTVAVRFLSRHQVCIIARTMLRGFGRIWMVY